MGCAHSRGVRNHRDRLADSRYRDEAEDLAKRLAAFDCPFMEERMIPQDSVFREFIG